MEEFLDFTSQIYPRKKSQNLRRIFDGEKCKIRVVMGVMGEFLGLTPQNQPTKRYKIRGKF